MKIRIIKPFDVELVPGVVMHLTPWPEPVTVKREIGTVGVEKGCATEVGVRDTPVRNDNRRLGRKTAAKAGPVADSGGDDAGDRAPDAGDMPDEGAE